MDPDATDVKRRKRADNEPDKSWTWEQIRQREREREMLTERCIDFKGKIGSL